MRKPTTGLQLPPVPPTEQQSIQQQWDTIGFVQGELAMKGFVPMDTPQFECPQVTEEVLTTADNNKYTEVYAQQLAWFNYSSQVLSQVTAHLLQHENEMDMISSRMRVAFRQEIKAGARDKMSKDEMEDEVNLNVRFAELKLDAQVLKQKKVQLQAFVDGIERSLRVISRQVEIKKIEAEGNRTNIPGRQYQRPGGPWRGSGHDE